MSTLHVLSAYASGNLSGQQAAQRDFSPFIVHFTNWTAMTPLRAAIKERRSSSEIASLLESADQRSWEVMKLILGSRRLLSRSPNQHHQVPSCVCFSECNLPGLIAHSERYGRFGLAFRKADLFELGARPCLYLGESEYAAIAKLGRGQPVSTPEGRLFGLSNVYVPPHTTNRVQDYTHEREWRLFADIELASVAPASLFAPAAFVAELSRAWPELPVVPIDMLFHWGA
jgi:hypothetical protein